MEPFYLRSSAQPTGHVEIKRHYLLTIGVLLEAMPDAFLQARRTPTRINENLMEHSINA